MYFFNKFSQIEEWPCYILENKDGNPPPIEDLNAISFGLNQFHDAFAVHMNEALQYCYAGSVIVDNLAANNQLEKISTSVGGKKEKINWEEIRASLVFLFI